MFERILSGGQTGVDRAALDVALELGVPCGGWCPRGRRSEEGPIDGRYPLQETPSRGYPQRTKWNVRDADGTLILTAGEPDRGTALTVKRAVQLDKPHCVANPALPEEVERVRAWARANGVRVLNVAGPRESSQPGIHLQAREFLQALLA